MACRGSCETTSQTNEGRRQHHGGRVLRGGAAVVWLIQFGRSASEFINIFKHLAKRQVFESRATRQGFECTRSCRSIQFNDEITQ
jgi:hypothetical protein